MEKWIRKTESKHKGSHKNEMDDREQKTAGGRMKKKKKEKKSSRKTAKVPSVHVRMLPSMT